ncbi:PfkB family carbohydrate kinase [Mucilaginibacter sp.]|jgi:sugar/nucleoside kinase (ribokinase family)|uniref:PfkB family carbohydrate kinase n=1 Tax=Mucilaginibacter sp. TaxID=1882438 RepID=UPI002D107D00|nr:PfkB family carbohydrate kinase [Mucilaginibacter sp.]HTI57397.1 PfkB family carbohydrate kinase [Mucilaginibacter sp.]
MYDICCVGHITLDKVVTTRAELHMAGGTAFYFSSALQNLDANYLLITSVAESEMHYVDELREKGIEIWAYPSSHTVYFENIYAEDQDHRTQNVLQQADPFSIQQMNGVEAKIYHLGPLLADDISTDFIRSLAGKGKISLDAQGYLRKVENQKVYPVGWSEKQEALQYIDILKADEAEMAVLTGESGIKKGALILAGWGVKEIVITNGSMGSTIYSDGVFYNIPAYRPEVVEDATGCGDTYMAGYLYCRTKGMDIQQSGEFAAAMASLKMESPGPFTGTEQEIIDRLVKTK